jgi:hypothetical protein
MKERIVVYATREQRMGPLDRCHREATLSFSKSCKKKNLERQRYSNHESHCKPHPLRLRLLVPIRNLRLKFIVGGRRICCAMLILFVLALYILYNWKKFV